MTKRNKIQYGEARPTTRAFRWAQRTAYLQVDATSYCNAKCVSCVRNHRGGDPIPHLKFTHLDLDLWKRVMTEDTKTIKLIKINFNGVWGDAIMHPQITEICQSITDSHPETNIKIDTNGSIRNPAWWTEFAKVLANAYSHKVEFAMDGLEDTHHLYRRNTSFKKICENIKAFTNAGGNADIVTTVFDHNIDQLDEISALAEKLGATRHFMRPSFDRNEESIDVHDGSYQIKHIKTKNFGAKFVYFKEDTNRNIALKGKAAMVTPCKWYQDKRVQIDPWGTVWPCCWTAKGAPQAKAITGHLLPGFDVNSNNLHGHKLLEILSNSWYSRSLYSIIEKEHSQICNEFCVHNKKYSNHSSRLTSDRTKYNKTSQNNQ
jgi:MoaA/NifB/PqqE/SkfB family radical SAM enzyme